MDEIEKIQEVINDAKKVSVERSDGKKVKLAPDEIFCLQELVNAGCKML